MAVTTKGTRKPVAKAKAKAVKPKAKTKPSAATKKVVKKLIQETKAKVKTKPKAKVTKTPAKGKPTTKGKKMAVAEVIEKKPVRRRLKTGGPGKAMREINSAQWAAFNARQLQANLAARGLTPSVVKVKMPEQKALALQVRTRSSPEWGTLKSIPINNYTPQKQLNEYIEELKELKIGWLITDYFGPDAEFQIAEITTRPYVAVY